jgi:hypothetical protein
MMPRSGRGRPAVHIVEGGLMTRFVGLDVSQKLATTRMWTAASSQGVLQCFDQIACVHMSGLWVRSHVSAGQDGFRDKGSKQQGGLMEGHWA